MCTVCGVGSSVCSAAPAGPVHARAVAKMTMRGAPAAQRAKVVVRCDCKDASCWSSFEFLPAPLAACALAALDGRTVSGAAIGRAAGPRRLALGKAVEAAVADAGARLVQAPCRLRERRLSGAEH